MSKFIQKVIALFIALCGLLGAPAYAEGLVTPRTETTLIADAATVTPGKPFMAVLHIKLKDDWHTYWKNPGDSGTTPMLSWTLPSGFTAGEIQYLPPERLPSGPLMDYGYHNDAYYLIPITAPTLINPNATIIIMVKGQWLVCKDVCVPEKGEFSLTMPVTPANAEPQPSTDAELINSLIKKLPLELAEPVAFTVENGNVNFSVKLPKAIEGTPKSTIFFPATDGIIANNAEQQLTVKGDTVTASLKQGDNKTMTDAEGLLSIIQADGVRVDYAIKLKAGAAPVVSAASGTPGTISISQPAPTAPVAKPVTPPAAPVITAENLSLLPAIILALLGGLVLNLMPCVLPILSLKVLSVAKKAESHASEVRKQALAYTAGVVLSFMLLAVLLITLQKLAGQSLGWGFQMQSPMFVAFLAVLMLLVALNLSGAFELPVLFGNVGSEKAAQDNALGSFLTGVLAVMVATPCSAPFMAPAIGFALTQSAVVVIVIFAALGFGLAAPFFLLSLAPGLAALLPKPGMWMLVLRQFLAFPIYLTVVWLLWVLAGEAGTTGAAIAMLAMVGAGFCIFLFQRQSPLLRFVGLIGTGGIIWGLLHTIAPSMQVNVASADYEPFSTARLDELRKQGKAVFVDATADWCITCKVNEAVALSKPEVKAAFAKQNIVKMVADWTRGDMEITDYLKSFERSGVPIYVYYAANSNQPKVLPQILTPAIVLEAIQ